MNPREIKTRTDIQGAFDCLEHSFIHNSIDVVDLPSNTTENLKDILCNREAMQTSQDTVFSPQGQGCAQRSCKAPCSGTGSLMKSFRKAGSQESTFRHSQMTLFSLSVNQQEQNSNPLPTRLSRYSKYKRERNKNSQSQ
ncbi:hypothetical protein AVEN_45602-1 [Araneus ventricosus]|uniref:Uncharacterized protein n=1 Tax=Araneus ventricosus TaxID=182803 RepID=A0A4Y2TLQ7_ARAVE|nr:hypothetical protein AVEN_45602-1 [Araneus ventricosus]